MIVFADPKPDTTETANPDRRSETTPLVAVALLSATIIFAAIGTTTVLAVEHIEHPEVSYFAKL